MEEWDGSERRHEYCPVHHIKCEEIKEARMLAGKRVPIWVFVLVVSIFSTVLGYQLTLIRGIDHTLNKVVHGLNEVALNQQRVLEKIELEFHTIPHYED